MIINGKKYSRKTYQTGSGEWYAAVEIRYRHRYSARTAYGERLGWKYSHSIELGRFPSREEAMKAAQERIDTLTRTEQGKSAMVRRGQHFKKIHD